MRLKRPSQVTLMLTVVESENQGPLCSRRAVVWAVEAGLPFFSRLVFEYSPGQFQILDDSVLTILLGLWGCGEKNETSIKHVPVLGASRSECFMCNILFNHFLQLVVRFAERVLSLTKILAPKGQIWDFWMFPGLCS